MGSARMAPKRATTLVLLVTISTQVLGEPGVWSALSFLGGGNAAGKRSTDETQELYPMTEDMDVSSRYEEVDYEEYGEEAEARIEPFRRRRKPYRRRRKPKPTSSQDFYSGDYTDRDSGYNAPQQSYDSPSYAESSPSYSGYGHISGVTSDVYSNSLDSESNMTGSEQGVNRGGYWQYRGMGGDDSNRRQDYGIYDYYGDYGEDLDEEEEEEESMFSQALQYFSGGLIGRNDDCDDEYCDYYDEPAIGFNGPLATIGNALRTLLPLGLLMASLVPSTVSVSGRRKREAEDSLLNSVDAVATEEDRPVLRRIAALGSAMWKPECQAEIFCQMVKLGQLPEGNSVQRMFAATAIHAPDFATNLLGLGGTFQASREGDCTKFKCGQ